MVMVIHHYTNQLYLLGAMNINHFVMLPLHVITISITINHNISHVVMYTIHLQQHT